MKTIIDIANLNPEHEELRYFKILKCISVLLFLFGYLQVHSQAYAEARAIKIIYPTEYRAGGENIPDQMSNNFIKELAKQIKTHQDIQFNVERYVVNRNDIDDNLIYKGDWDIAIVPADSKVFRTNGGDLTPAAFGSPFLFDGVEALRLTQQSSIGRAALSTLANDGVLGIDYLISTLDFAELEVAANRWKGEKGSISSLAQRMHALSFHNHRPSPMLVSHSELLDISGVNGPINSERATISSPLTFDVSLILTRRDRWTQFDYGDRLRLARLIRNSLRVVHDRAHKLFSPKFREDWMRDRRSALVPGNEKFKVAVAKRWLYSQPIRHQEYIRMLGKQAEAQKKSNKLQEQKINSHAKKIRFFTNRNQLNSQDFEFFFGDQHTEVVKCGVVSILDKKKKMEIEELEFGNSC
ncbi:MAG: hypothetical protein AAF441_20440, partial [Pseudomonadota bacterium]